MVVALEKPDFWADGWASPLRTTFSFEKGKGRFPGNDIGGSSTASSSPRGGGGSGRRVASYYVYANSIPVIFVDPSGNASITIAGPSCDLICTGNSVTTTTTTEEEEECDEEECEDDPTPVPIPPPPGGYSLVIYVDQPGCGGDRDTYEIIDHVTLVFKKAEGVDVGHTFVVLNDHETPETIGPVGRYPGAAVGDHAAAIPAVIRNDSGHAWDVKKVYTITKDGYKKAKDYISSEETTPTPYVLNTHNCTDFAVEVAGKAGVTLPDTTGHWPGGSGTNPGDMGEDLMGQGGVRNPATVCEGKGGSK